MTSPNRRDIVLDIEVRSDTKGVDDLNERLGDTEKGADRAGASLGEMSDDAKKLGVEIDKTKAKIADLRMQLLDVGNDRVIRSQIRQQQAWLTELERIGAQMPTDNPVVRAMRRQVSQGVGEGFIDGLDTIAISLSRIRGPAIVGVATIVAALGPALGGAIAGIVSGAVGVGGIAGGIAAASTDVRVRAEWDRFVDSLTAESFGAEAFVNPTIAAIKEIQSAVADMQIGSALELVADDVERLAEGVADFGRNFMPGFTEALRNAGPFVDALAEGIGDMGWALGHFLADLSASPGAVMALDATFDTINDTILLLGSGIRFLTDAFGGAVVVGGMLTGVLEDIPLIGGLWAQLNNVAEDWIDNLTPMQQGVARVSELIRDQSDATKEAERQFKELNEAISDHMRLTMSIAELSDEWTIGLSELKQQLRETGGDIRLNTEAGQRNRDAIRDQIQVAQQMREQHIRLTGDVKAANAEYEAQIRALEGVAEQSGITREELEGMAGDYRIAIKIDAAVSGIIRAAGQTVTAVSQAIRRVFGFAEGGTTPAHQPFIVGERGPEVMFSSRQHFVANQKMLSSTLSGASGGSARPVQVFGGGAAEVFFNWFEGELRNRGYRLAAVSG